MVARRQGSLPPDTHSLWSSFSQGTRVGCVNNSTRQKLMVCHFWDEVIRNYGSHHDLPPPPPPPLALREARSQGIRTFRRPEKRLGIRVLLTNTQVSVEADSFSHSWARPEQPLPTLTATLRDRLSQSHSSKLFLDSWPFKSMQDNKRLFRALYFRVICSSNNKLIQSCSPIDKIIYNC